MVVWAHSFPMSYAAIQLTRTWSLYCTYILTPHIHHTILLLRYTSKESSHPHKSPQIRRYILRLALCRPFQQHHLSTPRPRPHIIPRCCTPNPRPHPPCLASAIPTLRSNILPRQSRPSIQRYSRKHIRNFSTQSASLARLYSCHVHGRMSSRTFCRDGRCFCERGLKVEFILHCSTGDWSC